MGCGEENEGLIKAHHVFAVDCFNQCWEFIDKKQRTDTDTARMIQLASASLFHWTQVKSHGPKELSIGYWQMARVFALAKAPSLALMFGHLCLEISEKNSLAPFFIGYGHEALARGFQISGNRSLAKSALEKGFALLPQIEDKGDREMLEKDLKELDLQ